MSNSTQLIKVCALGVRGKIWGRHFVIFNFFFQLPESFSLSQIHTEKEEKSKKKKKLSREKKCFASSILTHTVEEKYNASISHFVR